MNIRERLGTQEELAAEFAAELRNPRDCKYFSPTKSGNACILWFRDCPCPRLYKDLWASGQECQGKQAYFRERRISEVELKAVAA